MQRSTETESILLHDPDVVWIRYFVKCQGYDINECIIYQDNMSALSLEKKGSISSSKQTKHISRQNLIKDSCNIWKIDICYCPYWCHECWRSHNTAAMIEIQGRVCIPTKLSSELQWRHWTTTTNWQISYAGTVASSRECVGKQITWE